VSLETGALRQAFIRELGASPAGVIRAPGRVNLIGEHIDYNGFGVLPMAIDRAVRAAWRPRADRVVRLRSADGYPPREFALEPEIPPYGTGDWGNYAKAAAQGLFQRLGGGAKLCGADLLVTSTLPPSAGLSSSSALVVLAALVLLEAARLSMPELALATLLADAEQYVGTQGGGMDQAASLLGRSGHALRIDFRPLRVTPIPLLPGHVIVVANSLARASKAESVGYNTRAAECRLAAAVLARRAGRDSASPAPLLADLAALAPIDDLLAALPTAPASLREVAALLGVVISLSAFYTAGIGLFDETVTRVGTLAVSMALALLAFPLLGGPFSGLVGRVIDLLLLALGAAIFWRYFEIGAALEVGLYDFTATDLWLGGAALLLLLELTRRVFGWPLVIVSDEPERATRSDMNFLWTTFLGRPFTRRAIDIR